MRAYKTLLLLSFCLPFLAALFSTEALAQSSNSVTLTTRREIGHELGLRLKGDRETFSFEGLDDVWEDEGVFIGKISSQKITVKGEFKSFNCTECDVDSFVINEAPTLETLILDKNNLQKIDLKKCDKLTWLSLIQNYFTELDLRENPTLKRLYCSFNQLAKLDISQNGLLYLFDCSNNNLDTLDIRPLKNLWYLYCMQNNLRQLYLPSDGQLKSLHCYNNKIKYSNMTQMMNDLPNRKGTSYSCRVAVFDDNADQVEKNRCLDSDVAIATDKNWSVITAKGSPYAGITPPDPTLIVNLTTEREIGDTLRLTFDADDEPILEGLSMLDYVNNQQIDCRVTANEIKVSGVVRDLRADSCSLKTIDFERADKLQQLRCKGNKLQQMDLTACKHLTYLNCEDNALETLTLYSGVRLDTLRCAGNRLSALKTEADTALRYLDCSRNQLETLQLGSHPNLTYLNFSENKLNGFTLKADSCAALTDIIAYGNHFSAEATHKFMNSLPEYEKKDGHQLIWVDSEAYTPEEMNAYAQEDLDAAHAKGWEVYDNKGGKPEILVVTGLHNIAAGAASAWQLQVTGEGIQISGAPARATYRLSDEAGRLLQSGYTDAAGKANVAFKANKARVYILTVGRESLKFMMP